MSKKPSKKGPSRPYEEIGAVFNGNEVKIRIPKSTSKPHKLTPSQQKLQDNCTCDDGGSNCSESCGFDNNDPENRLNFQVPDDICESLTNRNQMNSEFVYSKKEYHDTICNLCNVTPKNAPKGVNAQKVVHPDKDVFLLQIGKHTDEPNRTGNIEVELVTPRAPGKMKPAPHACKEIQCEASDLCCMSPCHMCRIPACPVPRRKKKKKCVSCCR